MTPPQILRHIFGVRMVTLLAPLQMLFPRQTYDTPLWRLCRMMLQHRKSWARIRFTHMTPPIWYSQHRLRQAYAAFIWPPPPPARNALQNLHYKRVVHPHDSSSMIKLAQTVLGRRMLNPFDTFADITAQKSSAAKWYTRWNPPLANVALRSLQWCSTPVGQPRKRITSKRSPTRTPRYAQSASRRRDCWVTK